MEDQPSKPISPSQQPFDTTLKDWISQQAADILPLLLPGTNYETTLTIELIRPTMRVDKVFQVGYDGGKCILHIEFETGYDKDLHSRLLVYNAILYRDYKLPVITLVIYPFQVKTAKSPLRIQTSLRKRTLITFHFEKLLLFKSNAWNILQQRHTCLYPLLPTMKGAQENLIMQAMEELMALYRHDNATLSQQFVWMRLFVERSSTIPDKKKEQIKRRLSMFDQLWEESKIVQKERETYLVKGIQRALLKFVEVRFPSLMAVAQQLTAQSHSPEQFQSLLDQLYRANTIEEAQTVLLNG